MKPMTDNYFARLQRREAEPPAVSSTLGGFIREFDVEAGTLRSDYVATSAFLNPAGQVQGGILGAMLDDVTAFLVTATLEPAEFCATLSLNLSFLRPAAAGRLAGHARLVRRGRDICHVEGELRQAGVAVATATAVCTIVRETPRRPAATGNVAADAIAHPSDPKDEHR